MLFENNRTEFKEELNEKLEKEVVAFLNNREGGVLYIGVNDAGIPVGVSDLDGTQLQIADRLKNNILPSTLGLFDIVTVIVDDIPVIKVEFPFSIKKDSSIIATGDENGNDIGDDNKVLNLLEKHPEITAKKMLEQLSMSPRKISRIIKRLRENNTIIRIGSDRKGYWEIKKNKDITNQNLQINC